MVIFHSYVSLPEGKTSSKPMVVSFADKPAMMHASLYTISVVCSPSKIETDHKTCWLLNRKYCKKSEDGRAKFGELMMNISFV